MDIRSIFYYLWMIHYSIVKKTYRKRRKNFKETISFQAVFYSFIFFFFVFVSLINKELLWRAINSHVPLAPLGGLLGVIIILLILLSSHRLTNRKVSILRKVSRQTRNIKHVYAILYACSFGVLFILTIIIGLSSWMPSYS